jgi:dihydroxyacetone kinase-like protein
MDWRNKMVQNQQSRSVGLADVFGSIVNQLQADQGQINAVDANGNHGSNMLHNFQLVANTVNGLRNQDAGTQLRQAATVLQNQGRGSTAGLYANGLLQAAQNLQGKSGVGANEVMPLIQGILGGVQQKTNAQPGQGTLLDTLLPAVTTYASARSAGSSNASAITSALGAALSGSQRTYQQPPQYGNLATQAVLPRTDPGAVSASSVLHGLFNSLTGV